MGYGSAIAKGIVGGLKKVGSVAKKAGSAVNKVSGGHLDDMARSAVSYAKDNPDAILGGVAMAKGALDAHNAGKTQRKAIGRLESSYNERSGLRKKAVSGLTRETRAGSLDDVYRRRSSNPFD
jgi:hypothetical protein